MVTKIIPDMHCSVCGMEIAGGGAFTCSYCAQTLCAEHRLPFNHACPNISEWKKAGRKADGRNIQKSPTYPFPYPKIQIIAAGVIILFLLMMVIVVIGQI